MLLPILLTLTLAFAALGSSAGRATVKENTIHSDPAPFPRLKVQLGLGHASQLEDLTWDSRLLHKNGPSDTHFMYQGELFGRYQWALEDGPDVLDDWDPILRRVVIGLRRWGPGGSEIDDGLRPEDFAGDLLLDIECFPLAIDDPDQVERCTRLVDEYYAGRWKDARKDYNGAVVQFFSQLFTIAKRRYPNARIGIYNGFRTLRSDAEHERVEAVKRYHDSLDDLLRLCEFHAPSLGYVMPDGSPIGHTIDNIPFQYQEVQRTLSHAGVGEQEITPITSPLYAAASDFRLRIGRPEWDRLLRTIVLDLKIYRPIVWMAPGEKLPPEGVQLIINKDVQPAIRALGYAPGP